MADLDHPSDSDSDSESAADELISQIKELCVLEQVSKINTCSFSDSLLPSHLETRFQKLKSFPSNSKSHNPHSYDVSLDPLKSAEPEEDNPNPDEEFKEKKSEDDQFLRSPSYSSKQISKKASKFDDDSPLNSPVSSISMDSPPSPPPPRKSGCFWCSPKKKEKKKEKLKMDWGIKKDDDEFLSALSSFSVKEQEKILRKAVKEEQKINREAEKIVKWAKQASNRMSFHGVQLDDDFIHDDDHKPKYV